MTIAKMSDQEHIFYLLHGIPRNNEWNVFFELMRDINARITTTPDEIVTKHVQKDAPIKRSNGLAPEVLRFAKKGGSGGKGGKGPKRDKRDNMDDKKEKDQRMCFHCRWRGHITENCLSMQCSDPPKAANTAAKASTETTPTLTTSIKNYWMVASSNA